MQQQRYICYQCKREWASGELGTTSAIKVLVGEKMRDWEPKDGCPRCHATEIELIRYSPPFPGGDIPRATILSTRDVETLQVIDAVNKFTRPEEIPDSLKVLHETIT